MPRPDRHRAALVRATSDLLQRQGYLATALDDVLVASGATNGSLYHHFPRGKEELALAALDASALAVERHLRRTLAGASDLSEALQFWIDELVHALETDPRRGCPVAPTALEAPAASEGLRVAAAAAFERWRSVLEEELAARGFAEHAPSLAHLLLAALEGALLLDRTAQRTDALNALKSLVTHLLDVRDA